MPLIQAHPAPASRDAWAANVSPSTNDVIRPIRCGATPFDWNQLQVMLGLGLDLLPVVSDQSATISPQSTLRGLGKTPSLFNSRGQAAGIKDWTSHQTTPAEIEQWSKDSRLGICLQTRLVRAIDCDIENADLAKAISEAIYSHLSIALPCRRGNAPKFLLAFRLPGDLGKRVIKTTHGKIEALLTGQQFVAVGTHPSGARYEWVGGLPDKIPVLTLEQFDSLWSMLEKRFGIEPSSTSSISVKGTKLAEAAANDPVAVALEKQGRVLANEKDGRLHITCPWEDEHTPGTGGESSTTYWPANTGGFAQGHFKCLHASHANKTDADFKAAYGVAGDPADDYEAVLIGDTPTGVTVAKAVRFVLVDDDTFSSGPPMQWIVKSVIPRAELGMIFGPPGSGKSFFALDLAMSIARGEPWCGCKVTPSRVVYVVAEGAGGFKNRIAAYRAHNNVPSGGLIKVLAEVPNLTKRDDVVDLGNTIIRAGGTDVLVYDTLARGTAGADENSAKDMGIAIAYCRTLHDLTGAMVILIHHSGKDASRGARGSNAVLGAVDVEIEIVRNDADRTAIVSKLKDGEDKAEYGFRLVTVPVGVDEDGDVISSCIVEYGAVVAKRGKQGRAKRLGANEERLWKAAVEAQRLDGSLPGTEEVISRAVAETPFDSGPGKRDRRREQFLRSLDQLVAADKLMIINGGVAVKEN